MIVKELIELLKTFPEDALVIYTAYSDYNPLETNDIRLITSEEKLISHKGHLMNIKEAWLDLRNNQFENPPEYLTAVLFPGN